MKIEAKLIEKKDIQTGQGKNGEWKKQDIIVETKGEFPKKICLTIWGSRINVEELLIGQEMIYHIDIESREYNGKWYTDVKAWKVEVESNFTTIHHQDGTIEEIDKNKLISVKSLSDESTNDDDPF